MTRFKVEPIPHSDPYGYGWQIIDTVTGRVLGDDRCEPEDAILVRDFKWVLTELNALADENKQLIELLECIDYEYDWKDNLDLLDRVTKVLDKHRTVIVQNPCPTPE